eukprot:GHVN01021252.1.p1 GENE.GHVN01021252.1~~GHVN01021252.1.p1  ORF type:complete len:878 (-),score=257.67 GHVN01021252.1:48-2291(-)
MTLPHTSSFPSLTSAGPPPPLSSFRSNLSTSLTSLQSSKLPESASASHISPRNSLSSLTSPTSLTPLTSHHTPHFNHSAGLSASQQTLANRDIGFTQSLNRHSLTSVSSNTPSQSFNSRHSLTTPRSLQSLNPPHSLSSSRSLNSFQRHKPHTQPQPHLQSASHTHPLPYSITPRQYASMSSPLKKYNRQAAPQSSSPNSPHSTNSSPSTSSYSPPHCFSPQSQSFHKLTHPHPTRLTDLSTAIRPPITSYTVHTHQPPSHTQRHSRAHTHLNHERTRSQASDLSPSDTERRQPLTSDSAIDSLMFGLTSSHSSGSRFSPLSSPLRRSPHPRLHSAETATSSVRRSGNRGGRSEGADKGERKERDERLQIGGRVERGASDALSDHSQSLRERRDSISFLGASSPTQSLSPQSKINSGLVQWRDDIQRYQEDFNSYKAAVLGRTKALNEQNEQIQAIEQASHRAQPDNLTEVIDPWAWVSGVHLIKDKNMEDTKAHWRGYPILPGRKSRQILSPVDRDYALSLLSRQGSELVTEKFNIEITHETLACLRPGTWLNDEVINFYMELLNERNKRQRADGERTPRCYFWSTFFYTKLSGENSLGGQNYSYESVKRWSVRKKVNIFSDVEIMVIPVHVRKIHWTLGAVDLRSHKIHFFDSLAGNYSEIFHHFLIRYLQDEHLDKKGGKLEVEWVLENDAEYTPQQNNGCDCGVFTCRFAECIGDGRAFDFGQDDIGEARVLMAAQIAHETMA